MDVRGWPVERILQLPDWVFGRSYILSCVCKISGIGITFDISELLLPNLCVVWYVKIWGWYTTGYQSYVRIGLGHFLPSTEAEFMKLKPIVHGLGITGAEPRQIHIWRDQPSLDLQMRMPLDSGGNKVCMMANALTAEFGYARLAVCVSAFPEEVPDWLISGQGKSL